MADDLIGRLVVALWSSHGRRCGPGILLPFRSALQGQDDADIQAAFDRASRECYYPPPPAELLRFCKEHRRSRIVRDVQAATPELSDSERSQNIIRVRALLRALRSKQC